MSYFSHHPEAYDEILAKGIARKIANYAGEDDRSQFEAFISNLQCDLNPAMRRVYDTLIEWAHGEIVDEERAYWERFVP